MIDWVRGGDVFHLDGSFDSRHTRYAFSFDAAISSPCGNYAVIYQRLGVKGLLLRDGKILRELNRSFYHAGAYEYPICLFTGPDGRTLLAHCPDEYTQIEIEDAETGVRMPRSCERDGVDIFHSRLRVSPCGRWLLSAGWLWHPYGDVAVFDLHAALNDTSLLDRPARHVPAKGEPATAEFLPDGRILIATYGEDEPDEEEPQEQLAKDDGELPPSSMGIFDPFQWRFDRMVRVDAAVGNLMPLDDKLALGFFDHPKLFSLESGALLQSWPSLASGKQFGCILMSNPSLPAVACDPAGRRFAVAGENAIHVVSGF